MCVAWMIELEGGPSVAATKGSADGPRQPYSAACPNGRSCNHLVLPRGRHPRAAQPEREVLRVARTSLGLRGPLPRLVPAELRGIESERSFLRDAERSFAHLFPGVVGGLWPSSFHRRLRRLRRFLEPLRRAVLPELVGDPETLIVDSTLLSVLHPRQVKQSAGWGSPSAGAAWVRWGSFSVYGAKLHPSCAADRVADLLRAYRRQRRRGAPDRRLLLDGANLGDVGWLAGPSETWPSAARNRSGPWPPAGSSR